MDDQMINRGEKGGECEDREREKENKSNGSFSRTIHGMTYRR